MSEYTSNEQYIKDLSDKKVLLEIVRFYTQGDTYTIKGSRDLLLSIMNDDEPM